MSLVDNVVLIHHIYSYLGMQTQEANFAAIDKLPHRICARAIEVLFKLSGLNELHCCSIQLKGLPWHKVVVTPVHFTISPVPCGVWCESKLFLRIIKLTMAKNTKALITQQPILTRNSPSKPVRITREQSLPQLILPTVWRTNQSNGAFAISWLVVQCHLFIGKNLLIVIVWETGWSLIT